MRCHFVDTESGREESKSVEVQRVWEINDDRLQYMALADASRLETLLLPGCGGLALLRGCPC